MYRLNEHSTLKQAMPGDRARQHRYYAHYYAMPCGDVYLITPKGQIKVVLADRDDCLLVWCPKDGLYPYYWTPSTTHLSIFPPEDMTMPTRICLDNSPHFGAPMTDDTLCIMTSPVSGLIIRRGVIIYDGKMDGRWVPAYHMGADDVEQIFVNNQWAKDENGKYLGKGTEPYNHWVWHKKVKRTQCKPSFDFNVSCDGYATDVGGAAGYIHIGQSRVLCCRTPNDQTCYDTPCQPFRYGNADEVTWARQVSWGRDPECLAEYREEMVAMCRPMGSVFVDKDRGGLPITNAIQDGRHGAASFQIESRVKRFKWRTWLGEIADVTELPGYAGETTDDSGDDRRQTTDDSNTGGEAADSPVVCRLSSADYIPTDWKAVRDYEIKMPEGNLYAGTVIRRGLQTGDCFYNEESDKYWRMEYNGWKEYDGYARRRVDDTSGKYGIITPDMTALHSAHANDE